MAGLTPLGLDVETIETLIEGINEDLQEAFGTSIDLTDNSVLGKIVGIFADRAANIWEVLEVLTDSLDPDDALGVLLHGIGAITGTSPKAAAPSEVVLTLTGTALTSILTGSQASTVSTLELFQTIADALLEELTPWAATTVYVPGDRVSNSSRSYICVIGGTSAGSGGPSGTTDAEVDNTVTWRYIGEGTAADDVDAVSVNNGPIAALSGDITTIETPVSGWDSVKNLNDADLGRNKETDEEFRVRRESELALPGTGPVDAIRADLLDVDDVTSVTVFHNPTGVTDADGIPPYAVEALVEGGADQDIWDALLAVVDAGTPTYGSEIGTATDTQGIDHTMAFSRPTEIPIYIILDFLYDANVFPIDGDTLIKSAIVNGSFVGKTGRDAVASAISKEAFDVTGMLDVTSVLIGTSPSPATSTTIAIALRELATYDSANITVNGTPAIP